MANSVASNAILPGGLPAEFAETASELRILIVEDSQIDAEFAKRALVRGGLTFSAEVVDSRDAFVERIGSFSPHVILSDFTMPGFSGGEAIVAMAHSLGLRALAEGVETETQLAAVQDLGCDLAQGFYWNPAVENGELFAQTPASNESRTWPVEDGPAEVEDAVRSPLRAMPPAAESP